MVPSLRKGKTEGGAIFGEKIMGHDEFEMSLVIYVTGLGGSWLYR